MKLFSSEAAAERKARSEERKARIREQAAQRQAAADARYAERKAAADARYEADKAGISEAREARAAEAARHAAAMTAKAAAAPRPVDQFVRLGVQIMDNGDLHTFSGFGRGRRLGPAAGAAAEIGAERKRHRVSGAVGSTLVLGPVGLAGAIGKKSKASSFVVLADGTVHEKAQDGNAAVTAAHKEVIRFTAAVRRLEAAG